MAKVQKYGKSVKDPNTISLSAAVFAEGRVRAISTGVIAIANGDSIDSRLYFGKVPSSAIILPHSTLYHGSATGVTDFDIGFERLGQTVSVDKLADGLTLASAGSKSIVAAVTTGNLGKRVYELLGLTTDPGCEYDIVGTLKTAATADAVVEAFIYYAKK